MDQREDYAEPDARPPWFLRFLFRRALPIGLAVTLIGGIALLLFGVKARDGDSDTYRSIVQAEDLAAACREYSRRSPDGRFPTTLTDLQSPPADLPLLDGRDDELIDAWGNPFRYAVMANAAGELEPYVWSERTGKDGRTTLIGAKVAADGSIVRFGLPPRD